jgi:hypothetical protein
MPELRITAEQDWVKASELSCIFQSQTRASVFFKLSADAPTDDIGLKLNPYEFNYFEASAGKSLWVKTQCGEAVVYIEHEG